MIDFCEQVTVFRDDEDGLRFYIPDRRSRGGAKPLPSRRLDVKGFRRWLRRYAPEVLRG